MKKISIGSDEPGYYADTEHSVLTIDSEGVLLAYVRQIDDLLINTPDGPLLIAWDINHEIGEFNDNQCMYISEKDNMKEISNLKTSLIAIKTVGDKPLKVYITAQRN